MTKSKGSTFITLICALGLPSCDSNQSGNKISGYPPEGQYSVIIELAGPPIPSPNADHGSALFISKPVIAAAADECDFGPGTIRNSLKVEPIAGTNQLILHASRPEQKESKCIIDSVLAGSRGILNAQQSLRKTALKKTFQKELKAQQMIVQRKRSEAQRFLARFYFVIDPKEEDLPKISFSKELFDTYAHKMISQLEIIQSSLIGEITWTTKHGLSPRPGLWGRPHDPCLINYEQHLEAARGLNRLAHEGFGESHPSTQQLKRDSATHLANAKALLPGLKTRHEKQLKEIAKRIQEINTHLKSDGDQEGDFRILQHKYDALSSSYVANRNLLLSMILQQAEALKELEKPYIPFKILKKGE
jgi:hypothetical protein